MALPHSVKVVYGGSNKIGSLLIRAFTGSPVSHIGLVVGSNVIESVAGKGVILTPTQEFVTRYRSVYTGDFPSLYTPPEVNARAATMLGKPYDYTAIFGVLFRQNWDDPDSWICSELIAWATGAVTHSVSRFTPQDALAITQNLTRIK